MSVLFMDTSAIAKRYIAEVGSGWIIQQVSAHAGHFVVISTLTTVEMISIFSRQAKAQYLAAPAALRLRRAFLRHAHSQYGVFKLGDNTFIQARHVAVKHALRALDALQLACALEVQATIRQSLTFVTSDTELFNAAAAEGFAVDNPLHHP